MAWSPTPSQPAMTVRSTNDRAGRPKVRDARSAAHRGADSAPGTPGRGCSPTLTGAGPPALPVAGPASRPAFGEGAEQNIALALARAGCVALDHDYRSGQISSPRRGWTPHPSLADGQASAKVARRDRQSQLAASAAALSSQLAAEWPGVASALATSASDARLIWMVRAAEDLTQGRSHDGARAFVQAHAASTKAREDLPHLLADAGFEPDALTQLGISPQSVCRTWWSHPCPSGWPYPGFQWLAGPPRHPAARRRSQLTWIPSPVPPSCS